MKKKLTLFEKYKHTKDDETKNNNNDIIESFDEIFNMKKDQEPKEVPHHEMFKKKMYGESSTMGNKGN